MSETTKEENDLLEKLYDFVLEPSITRSERQIGLMAKTDLEKNRYPVAVANQLVASFQQLALQDKGLTPVASEFYKVVYQIFIDIKPIGTALGYLSSYNSYLN